MKAILIGAVESTRVALRAIADAGGWELTAVATLPPTLAARHSDFVDLSDEVDRVGSKLLAVADINSEDALAAFAGLAADYIFVIGWSQLCGPQFLAQARLGVVGYHPAPLPRLRGRGVIPWTILLREPITASTLFRIDAGTDSGPILAQEYFHVADDETAATLYAGHMAALGRIMPAMLDRLGAGDAPGVAQDERHATWAARRRPEDGRIDWSQPADDVCRLVRACGDPYPGAWTTLGEEQVGILAAQPVAATNHQAAIEGQIIERDGGGFAVKCGGHTKLVVSRWRRTKTLPPPLHAVLGRVAVPS